jgi:hypothetical protein
MPCVFEIMDDFIPISFQDENVFIGNAFVTEFLRYGRDCMLSLILYPKFPMT